MKFLKSNYNSSSTQRFIYIVSTQKACITRGENQHIMGGYLTPVKAHERGDATQGTFSQKKNCGLRVSFIFSEKKCTFFEINQVFRRKKRFSEEKKENILRKMRLWTRKKGFTNRNKSCKHLWKSFSRTEAYFFSGEVLRSRRGNKREAPGTMTMRGLQGPHHLARYRTLYSQSLQVSHFHEQAIW